MTSNRDSSLVRVLILIGLVYAVYAFVLTAPQKSSINTVIQDISRTTTKLAATGTAKEPTAVIARATARPIVDSVVISNGKPIATAVPCGPNVPSTVACVLPAGGVIISFTEQVDLTPLPTLEECYAGSFYSCADLEKMRDESRTAAANGEGTAQDEAVVATDAFMIVPTTPPAVLQQYIDACNSTAKDKRGPFLGPICEGAGL